MVRDSKEFHLVRSRLQVRYAASADVAVETFEAYLDRDETKRNEAVRYGLAVAYQENNQPEKSIALLEELLGQNPGRITFQVTLADVLTGQNGHRRLEHCLRTPARNPENYPIMHSLAEAELADGNGATAAEILTQLTRMLPGQENLWLRLAEAEGMARNIVGVHRARAEYDALMGNLEAAQRQLRQAQEKLPAGSRNVRS